MFQTLILKTLAAATEKVKNHEDTSFREWIEKHKKILLLSFFTVLSGGITAITLYFSDSGFIKGITHLKEHIELLGIPTDLHFNTSAVWIGMIGTLFTGITAILFAITVRHALSPQKNMHSLIKNTIKTFLLPTIVLMISASCFATIPYTVCTMFWDKYLNTAFELKCYAQIISGLLLQISVTFVLLFIITGAWQIKWSRIFYIIVFAIFGISGIASLIYLNILQPWFLLPHCMLTASFSFTAILFTKRKKITKNSSYSF